MGESCSRPFVTSLGHQRGCTTDGVLSGACEPQFSRHHGSELFHSALLNAAFYFFAAAVLPFAAA